MRILVGAELLKLRTLRGPRWIAAVTLLLAALIGVVGVRVTAGAEETVAVADLARAPVQAAWFAVALLAVLASAGEFQHRTIRTTLLAVPRRPRVLGAKALSAAVAGIALVAAAVLTCLAAGLLTAVLSGADLVGVGAADVARVAAGIGLGGVWAVVATGVGMLTRSTAAALVALLLWRFVGEAVVPMVLRDPGAYAWTPSGAGDALVGVGGHLLPVGGAAALLALYVAVVCAAAGVLFVRRDPA